MALSSCFSFLSGCFPLGGRGRFTTRAFDIPKVPLGASKVSSVAQFCLCASLTFLSIVLMCQWFAPTHLVITFETEGLGKFTPEEIEQYIVRNERGEAVSLDLPTKFVLIANHQVRNSIPPWRLVY